MSRIIAIPRVVPILMAALLAVVAACSDSGDAVNAPRQVASVVVSPNATALVVGQTAALAAIATDAKGSVIDGRTVQWVSSNSTIATVSSSGVVSAVAEGAATVSATIDGKVGQAQVTVARVPVARVGISPTTVVLEPPRTRQLTAVAFDAAGNVLEGRAVQWFTDAPAVATVSPSGLVQAVARGYATITATIEGRSSSIAVTVPEPEAAAFDLVYERRPFNGGGEIRRLLLGSGTSVALPLVVSIEGTFVRDVVPSPDGTRVAFTVAWYPQGWSTLDGDVYVASVDGTNVRRLTTAEELDDQPAWSPDGSRIVYASDIDNLSYSKLWTMRPDGTDKRRLFPLTAPTFEVDREPSWSPDGTKLAFRRIASNAAGSDIMIASLTTGVVSRIAMDGVQSFPAWSPDGKLIAFTSNHEGLLSHVYTMKPNGTEVVRYTTGVDENTYPRWLRTALPAGGVASR